MIDSSTCTTGTWHWRRRGARCQRRTRKGTFLSKGNFTAVTSLAVVMLLVDLLTLSSWAQAKPQSSPLSSKQSITSSSTASANLRRNTAALSSRIVGGKPVSSRDAYPFFVQWQDKCGGSLIWEDIMLTAAHCDFNENPFGRRVYIGGTRRGQGVTRNMVKRTAHPQWDASILESNNASDNYIAWDFLVVKLNESLADVPGTLPIELNADASIPQGGEDVVAMGYGRTSHTARDAPNYLRNVDLQVFSNEECSEFYGNTRVLFQSDSMLCAGIEGGGMSTCQGDSGGPLVMETALEDGTTSMVQLGVVSWGEGCGAPDYPGVYARVSAAHEWIQEQICRWSCSPPSTCDPAVINMCAQPESYPRNLHLVLRVVHDKYPAETAIVWEHLETATELFFQEFESQDTDMMENDVEGDPWIVEVDKSNLFNGTYHLIIADTARDGICCEYGDGSVTLINGATGEVLFFNNNFTDKLEFFIQFDEDGNVIWNSTDYYDDTDEFDDQGDDEEANGEEGTNEDDSEPEAALDFNPDNDQDWPGIFPLEGATHQIAINVKYDDYPQETNWLLEYNANHENDNNDSNQESENSSSGGIASELRSAVTSDLPDNWTVVDQQEDGIDSFQFVSSLVRLESSSLYRFTITDQTWDFAGDGICCRYGQGWVSITNGTASDKNPSGTILWQLPGNAFTTAAQVYFWVDANGLTEVVEYTAEPKEEVDYSSLSTNSLTIPPDLASTSSAGTGNLYPSQGGGSQGSSVSAVDNDSGSNGPELNIPVLHGDPWDP